MYEIERFFVNVRKLAALNIADQVNETVCIDNTITLDVNITDHNYCTEKSELLVRWELIRASE